MGAILITSLTPATIGLWIVGLVFVILGSDYDQEKRKLDLKELIYYDRKESKIS